MVGRPRMSREEAEASLAKWLEKHPGKGYRKGYAALGDDITMSRFVKLPGEARPAKPKGVQLWLKSMRHKAQEEGRTIFGSTVKHPSAVKKLLVSGHSNVKIGRDVRKGRLFRGYWIYTLTLEERATCPRTCHHWDSCYGNNMPWATRLIHGKPLVRRLERELRELLRVRGRVGILIRLHALGDFYSTEYVAFWDAMLKVHPRLAVYGYTARLPGTEIGDAIGLVKARHGRRFAIRYSDGGQGDDCTVSLAPGDEAPALAFVCPEQTGRTAHCATCGLCWNTAKNVAFLEH